MNPKQTDLYSVIWLLIVLLALALCVTIGGIWYIGAQSDANEKELWKLQRRVQILENTR